jgi:hypothetical protein
MALTAQTRGLTSRSCQRGRLRTVFAQAADWRPPPPPRWQALACRGAALISPAGPHRRGCDQGPCVQLRAGLNHPQRSAGLPELLRPAAAAANQRGWRHRIHRHSSSLTASLEASIARWGGGRANPLQKTKDRSPGHEQISSADCRNLRIPARINRNVLNSLMH